MGDSITARWWFPRANLGVSGNTTTQMLARFQDEVLGHNYRQVIILGGTNDMRITSLPVEQETDLAIKNIKAMASMADSGGLDVVLCTIPPIQGEEDRSIALNIEIAKFAQTAHYKLIDYFTPLDGHPEYFVDTLHPNSAGYFVMLKTLLGVLPQSD